MRLIMSGELIDGETAARIGLVEAAVAPDALEAHVMALAAKIAVRSPLALQAAKESILAARRMPLDEGLKFERGWFSLLFSTDDMAEGVGAFLEKRSPSSRAPRGGPRVNAAPGGAGSRWRFGWQPAPGSEALRPRCHHATKRRPRRR